MVLILYRFVLAICIVFLLNACAAKKSMVVLLPDQDGITGAIEVRNQGGSLKLDSANQATEILSSQTAPTPPKVLSEGDITRMFGETLSAIPGAPVHYLLYFLSDSKELTKDSKDRLDEVLVSIKKIQPAEISIVGHTDRVGEKKRNFRLGFERAMEVKSLLIQRGVDPAKIEISSHGEDNPLIRTADEVPEPGNRRVEIVLR